jgi:hypothetical protein
LAPEEQFQPQKEAVEEDAGHFAEAYQRWIAQVQPEPTASQFTAFLRSEYGITTAVGGPLSDEQLQPLLRVLQHRYAAPADPVITPDDTEGVPEEEPSWEEFFSTGPAPAAVRVIAVPEGAHAASPHRFAYATAVPRWVRADRVAGERDHADESVLLVDHGRPLDAMPCHEPSGLGGCGDGGWGHQPADRSRATATSPSSAGRVTASSTATSGASTRSWRRRATPVNRYQACEQVGV